MSMHLEKWVLPVGSAVTLLGFKSIFFLRHRLLNKRGFQPSESGLGVAVQ